MAEAPVRCLKCGLLLAGRSLEGLCAACLLESSLEPEPEPEESSVDVEWLNRRGLGTAKSTTPTGRRFGEYELEVEVARGGMGIIYRARHSRLNRVVALKMILPGPLATPDFLARFQNEARAAATLDHPNLVSVHEVGEVEGQPYYTMRLVEGPDLAQEIRQDGALPARRAAEIMATVARAVHYAHEHGVLHRDLKPANILLDAEGQPHVTDFGLAKLLEQDSGLTLTQAALGTPSYMAPEIARGQRHRSRPASDIYSLGAVLYELCTGSPPFRSKSAQDTLLQIREQSPVAPRLLNRTLPRDLEVICLKCLEKETARRYASAGELADDLGRFLSREPILARAVGPLGRSWRWAGRKPVLAGTVGALIVVVFTGLIGVVSQWYRAEQTSRRETEQRRQAEANLLEARRNLYAADMNLAGEALAENDLGQAATLLERHAPQRGESDLRGWEWYHLNSLAVSDEHFELGRHDRVVSMVRHVPGSDRIASLAFDGLVRTWGLSSRRCEGEFMHGGLPGGLAIDRTGQFVACASGLGGTDRKFVQVLDLASGDLVELITYQGSIYGIALSPDGQSLAARSNRQIGLFDLPGGALRCSWPASREMGTSVHEGIAFSTDGRMLAFHEGQGVVTLVDTASTHTVVSLPTRSVWVESITFSPDNVCLVAGGQPGAITVWEMNTWRQITNLTAHRQRVSDVVFSPDGRMLASASADQSIILWDTPSWRLLRRLHGHNNEVWSVDFLPHTNLLVSAGKDGRIKAWTLDTPREPTRLSMRLEGVALATLAADGTMVLAVTTNRECVLVDCRTLTIASRLPLPSFVEPVAAAIHPTANLIAFGTARNEAVICEMDSLNSVVHIGGLPEAPFSMAFSYDARYLGIGGNTQSVQVYDWRSNQLHLEFSTGMACRVIAFARTDPTLAVGLGLRQGVYRGEIWSLTTKQKLCEVGPHNEDVLGVAFSPDGLQLASASSDAIVGLWSVPDGTLRSKLTGQKLAAAAVAFSMDGSRLCEVGHDQTALLWDVGSPSINRVARFTGLGVLEKAAFLPDGERLVAIGTRGGETTVHLWIAPGANRL